MIPPYECTYCNGKGWSWIVPGGFNPFYAGGAIAASNAAERRTCQLCGGTGVTTDKLPSPSPSPPHPKGLDE